MSIKTMIEKLTNINVEVDEMRDSYTEKIDNLESKDNLTDMQQENLDRYQEILSILEDVHDHIAESINSLDSF